MSEMSKMIPSQIDSDSPSSERRVFERLRNVPNSKDWIVFHSLGLARRGPRKPFGEIDFVVIIPGEGIICLEVKGGRISCRNGDWYSVDRYDRSHRLNKSPFMQARAGMFTLKNFLANKYKGALPPLGYAVVFPDVDCPPITTEFERCDVIDRHDLRNSISQSLMLHARLRLREFQPRNRSRRPDPSEVAEIRNLLRPDFDLVVAKSVKLEIIEEKLLTLTQEQYDRLDELEDNPRCLFQGGAGTGKTLLAVESARRAAHNGEKVLLVCFNRLLAGWMREQLAGMEIRVDTWHEVARSFILRSSIAKEFRDEEAKAFTSEDPDSQPKFFGDTYHTYAAMAMQEYIENSGRPFDRLIVDEAQDIIGDEEAVEFLDLALQDGLGRGKWTVLGDFRRQTLFSGPMDPRDILENYTDNFVSARLTLNCRNTWQIAEAISIMTGAENVRRVIDADAGLPVVRRYYKNPESLIRSLNETVDRLVERDGLPVEDIVILSPRRLANSPLSGIERISKFPLVDLRNRKLDMNSPSIKFSTIHAFKGLESKAVIIVDIDNVDSDWMQSALYVGMSRAQSLLTLMISERARKSS